MSKKSEFPPIDLYSIDFPSDKVTLGQARKLDHAMNGNGVFRSSDILNSVNATDILSVIPLSYEMELAEKIYAKTLGLPDPNPLSTRADLVSILRDEWKEFGISGGSHQSTQMIRDIERAAIIQAKQHLSNGR